MSSARACADEPDAKRARKNSKQSAPILYSASKSFKGLSFPDLPPELQSHILTQVTQGIEHEGEDCVMKVRCRRLALLRRLGRQLSNALLSKMCIAAFHAETNKHKKWREALDADPSCFKKRSVSAQLTHFFNRDVLISMLMRTYDKTFLNGSRANGRAAFNCLQIMFKIHDVEHRWYLECLEAIVNEQSLPVFRPAQSEEWNELYHSFC
tara:strand:- start:356 stop:985 length:630 start_codon:yes stop_codon:yes gene_type:complete